MFALNINGSKQIKRINLNLTIFDLIHWFDKFTSMSLHRYKDISSIHLVVQLLTTFSSTRKFYKSTLYSH